MKFHKIYEHFYAISFHEISSNHRGKSQLSIKTKDPWISFSRAFKFVYFSGSEKRHGNFEQKMPTKMPRISRWIRLYLRRSLPHVKTEKQGFLTAQASSKYIPYLGDYTWEMGGGSRLIQSNQVMF